MGNDRVQVYRNLHNGLLSVRDKRTNKILCHAHGILLKNVKFVVRESGRQRVLREQRKNVHAWVEGEIAMIQARSYKGRPVPKIDYDPSGLAIDLTWDFTYNPYKYDSFVDNDAKPVYTSEIAWLYVPADGGPLLCKYGQMTELTP